MPRAACGSHVVAPSAVVAGSTVHGTAQHANIVVSAPVVKYAASESIWDRAPSVSSRPTWVGCRSPLEHAGVKVVVRSCAGKVVGLQGLVCTIKPQDLVAFLRARPGGNVLPVPIPHSTILSMNFALGSLLAFTKQTCASTSECPPWAHPRRDRSRTCGRFRRLGGMHGCGALLLQGRCVERPPLPAPTTAASPSGLKRNRLNCSCLSRL